MKKIISIILVCFTSLLFLSCENSLFEKEDVKAERLLSEYLKQKYKEEFIILWGGKRSLDSGSWYEYAIIPQSIVGTNKEHDGYYMSKGFVEIKGHMEPGDNYGKVLLNESANAFYGKKLKELFGENFLAVINMEGPYDYADFEMEMDSRKPLYKNNPTGNYYPISGGIYIFGRVENDEDREWYRTQIYEFVQFMKKTRTFEYVSLGILVLDERILSKEFQENDELKKKLVEVGNKYKESHHELFREERRRLMNTLSIKLSECININNINKSSMKNSVDWSYYNNLLTVSLYSKKYIESNNLTNEEITKYDKIETIKFEKEHY
jgi:hypothetical protein